MKVDTIETRYGNVEVEYSSFTKGFFVKKYPEKMESINGLKLLKSRDNSFKEFAKLEQHVKDLIHNAMVDFEFSRKVIIYKIKTFAYDDGLSFLYMVCDESVKNQKYCGKENELKEYFVHESNLKKYVGMRNIFGQIVFEREDDYVFIDYDESIHEFFKNFTVNFHKLKESLITFFDKEKVVFNIMNSQSDLKMLGAAKGSS